MQGALRNGGKMYDSKADRIKACEEKFEVLFGKKPNEGEGNDPELFQILQRFIFGQVSYLGSLNDQTRELITCVVLAVYQTLPQLRSHAAAALHIGISPLQLREAVYNCMPMIGCPKTLNAIGAVDEILTEKGIILPLESGVTITEDERFEKGAAIQQPLYGDEIRDNMKFMPAEFAEAVPDFLTTYCFGDFYTRKGLEISTRELLNMVILVALGGCENQLKPHILGCLKTGNTIEDIYTAVVHAMPYTGIPRAFNAIYVIRDVAGMKK